MINKTIEITNGWIVLVNNIKYGNTPPISVDKISHFAYFNSDIGDDEHRYYILFHTLGGEARWYFNTKGLLMQTYEELLQLIVDKTYIGRK